MRSNLRNFRQYFNRTYRAVALVLFLIAVIIPATLSNKIYAANQLTTRSLTISTASNAGANATASYVFSFKPGSTGASTAVNGLQFLACTTAIGTCTVPTGFSWASATYGSQVNWGDNATAFAKDATGLNDCIASASVLCAKRTGAATNETNTTAHTITFNAVQNPTAANGTFFIRITTYNLNTYTVGSILDTGTVASSTVQTLTINASVQETLSFCVGATTIDDATTSVGVNCTAISGSSVNLGTLDSTVVSTTPVSAGTGGSATNAIAMLKTNASNGSTVSYKAVQATTGTNHLGTLRVAGSTCNAGNVNTDQCIDAKGTTQGAFSAGTEKFGMTVAGTNCSAVLPASYSCVFTSGSNNLKASANYIGATATTYGATSGFAWDETGTAAQIAATSTVVDNESLIIKFAATPSITTPPGSYTAQAEFIAVATY
jgi:hypothetical protein